MKRMISDRMFELMMHMVGFNFEENFQMVMLGMLSSGADYTLDRWKMVDLIRLAAWCDAKWGTDVVPMLQEMKEAAEVTA